MPRLTPDRVTQATALIVTSAVMWAVHGESQRERTETASPQRAVAVSLLEDPPQPESPHAEPPRPEPERPKPKRPVEPPRQQRAAYPSATAVVDPSPMLAEPAAETAEVVMASAPAPAPPSPSHASAEDEYAAALRRNVDARTSVPNSAEYRLLRPSGAALVRFALDRVGVASDVTIAHSSGSGILDRQAVSIVSSGHYPAFPDAAYPGETRHVFLVTIEFRS